MKKKQVALLLAALMCITSVAESAAVMGAEFSSLLGKRGKVLYN